jgi:hypothetical protein
MARPPFKWHQPFRSSQPSFVIIVALPQYLDYDGAHTDLSQLVGLLVYNVARYTELDREHWGIEASDQVGSDGAAI